MENNYLQDHFHSREDCTGRSDGKKKQTVGGVKKCED